MGPLHLHLKKEQEEEEARLVKKQHQTQPPLCATCDLVEEALIVAWFNKSDAGGVLGVPADAAREVRAASKPFVEWLEEADSDESDSEEDEEEESDDE